jgi:3-oxoacyl-[acyl-carrier-protein] synthase II
MVSVRLAVAGMAWSTPLGNDLDSVWARLLAGESGLRPVPSDLRLRNLLAAQLDDPPVALPAGQRLRQLTTRTVLAALADAGIDPTDPGLGAVFATSLGAFLDDPNECGPLHQWADDAATAAGLVTPPVVLSTACSSGADAVAVGAELVRARVVRACVCGGADVLTAAKRLGHSALTTMSPTSLRAFHPDADGTLLGEGAGFLVLTVEHSRPRAWFRGAGSGNDAAALTTPDVAARGAVFALRRSLAAAGIAHGEVAVVNAHGSGTPANESAERVAFSTAFPGPARPVLFATKGNFGHSLGATGAIEAISTVLALQDRRVPPVVGLEGRNPDFDFPIPFGTLRPIEGRFGLSLTLGFGGFDTSLVFERSS